MNDVVFFFASTKKEVEKYGEKLKKIILLV